MALIEARRITSQAGAHAKIQALIGVCDSIARDAAKITVYSLQRSIADLLTTIIQYPENLQTSEQIVALYQETVRRITANDVLHSLRNPNIQSSDILLDQPVMRPVRAIMPEQPSIPMFWQSGKFQAAWDRAMNIAGQESNVLIQAERGSGKELFARSMHENSSRKSEKFVVVNSTTIPPGVAHSILFGHTKGAFTSATADRKGLVHLADGGTMFIDEIGNMPIEVQELLLRCIEYGDFRSVGEQNGGSAVNVRFIVATNRDLAAMTARKEFLPDLLDRLPFTVDIPPLRDRADLPELAQWILQNKLGGREMDMQCVERLRTYHWPGNVRELESALRNAATLEPGGLLHWEAVSKYLRYR